MAKDEFDDDEEFGEDVDDDELELADLDELGDLDFDAQDEDGEDELGADGDELEGLDDADEADELVEDEEEDEEGEDEEAEDEEAEDEEEESLDVLLAREQDMEDDLVRLDDEPRGELSGGSTTPMGADEFTCRSCFLVKRRAQLADEARLICWDCA